MPGILALLIVVYLIYRIFPPSIQRTPEAAELANEELKRLGAMKRASRSSCSHWSLACG